MSRAVRKLSILDAMGRMARKNHRYLSALDISRCLDLSCSTHLHKILSEMVNEGMLARSSFDWKGHVSRMTLWCLPEYAREQKRFKGF